MFLTICAEGSVCSFRERPFGRSSDVRRKYHTFDFTVYCNTALIGKQDKLSPK